MSDHNIILNLTIKLLESINSSDNALNALISSQNLACNNLSKYFSNDENLASHDITQLIALTSEEAIKYKKTLQCMKNSADKMISYIKYPSLRYFWV